MRLWHLLYEVLTETTSVQPIVLSYPQLNSMLSPRGIYCNTIEFFMLLNTKVVFCLYSKT